MEISGNLYNRILEGIGDGMTQALTRKKGSGMPGIPGKDQREISVLNEPGTYEKHSKDWHLLRTVKEMPVSDMRKMKETIRPDSPLFTLLGDMHDTLFRTVNYLPGQAPDEIPLWFDFETVHKFPFRTEWSRRSGLPGELADAVGEMGLWEFLWNFRDIEVMWKTDGFIGDFISAGELGSTQEPKPYDMDVYVRFIKGVTKGHPLHGYYRPKGKRELREIVKCAFSGMNLNWVDVSKIKSMSGLFRHGEFDISAWDVSSATDMSDMFCNNCCEWKGVDLNGWDIRKVRTMESMFYNSGFNGEISRWDVSGVRDMGRMFIQSKFSGDLSGWLIPASCKIDGMFAGSVLGQKCNASLMPRFEPRKYLGEAAEALTRKKGQRIEVSGNGGNAISVRKETGEYEKHSKDWYVLMDLPADLDFDGYADLTGPARWLLTRLAERSRELPDDVLAIMDDPEMRLRAAMAVRCRAHEIISKGEIGKEWEFLNDHMDFLKGFCKMRGQDNLAAMQAFPDLTWMELASGDSPEICRVGIIDSEGRDFPVTEWTGHDGRFVRFTRTVNSEIPSRRLTVDFAVSRNWFRHLGEEMWQVEFEKIAVKYGDGTQATFSDYADGYATNERTMYARNMNSLLANYYPDGKVVRKDYLPAIGHAMSCSEPLREGAAARGFLPSVQQFEDLYLYAHAIDIALSMTGGPSLVLEGTFWTCNQFDSINATAYTGSAARQFRTKTEKYQVFPLFKIIRH